MSRRRPTFLEAALLGEVDATHAALDAWPAADGFTDDERALVATAADGLALVLLAHRFGLPLDALVELDRHAMRVAAGMRTAARGIAVLSERPAELAELLAWAERNEANADDAATVTAGELAGIGGGGAT